MIQLRERLPLNTVIRVLGIAGALCALVGAVCGVTMLLIVWASSTAPHILTQLAMILLPLAMLLLIAAILLAMIRGRL